MNVLKVSGNLLQVNVEVLIYLHNCQGRSDEDFQKSISGPNNKWSMLKNCVVEKYMSDVRIFKTLCFTFRIWTFVHVKSFK